MSSKKAMEPILIDKTDRGDHYTHPAFAMIGASRISHGGEGGRLFGSDLRHNHYVTLRIKTATQVRYINHDWHHGDKQIIEVAMSEAQWASFVSSMNIGDGVPCTLLYGPPAGSGLEEKPGFVQQSRHKLMQEELKQYTEDCVKDLAALEQEVAKAANNSGGVSKTWFKEMASKLHLVKQALQSNVPYHLECHKELMEKNVEAAKSEIEGYVTQKAINLGISELRKEAPQLEHKGETNDR